jgi:HAD superfamily hydrolase (TIGR01490 family)
VSIAFFDLDRTILSVNSGVLWIKAEWRDGRLSVWQGLEAAFWLVRYSLGTAGLEDALRKSVGTLKGDLESELAARTQAFYEREVQGLVRPGARESLATHRQAGDRLVLLTASSNYLSEPISRALELDDFVCNAFEVDADGRYTGHPVEPICYGQGKVERARAYAETAGVALSECTFYSDSASDLPMLEVVGRPVAVNPDPQLLRVARRRGWPVEDWGEP